MDVSEAILALRARRQYTQRQLADALRVSSGAVAHWERGIRKPGPSLVIKMCGLAGDDSDLKMFFLEYSGVGQAFYEQPWVQERTRQFARDFAASGDRSPDLSSPAPSALSAKSADQKPLPPDLARAREIAHRAVEILAEQAAGGDGAALALLKHYADSMMDRAGQLSPPPPEPPHPSRNSHGAAPSMPSSARMLKSKRR